MKKVYKDVCNKIVSKSIDDGKMNKPIWPKGKVLIEGIGYFKDGEVPKWVYVTQKLMMMMCMLIPIGLIALWIVWFIYQLCRI